MLIRERDTRNDEGARRDVSRFRTTKVARQAVSWPGMSPTNKSVYPAGVSGNRFAGKAETRAARAGQVVEFRRAQSVPSFYSAVISTAVLAAQIVFAEVSGVDVATEVYRVSDGMCVMSRRDRSQQKYVVQAEKTVRRIAEGMSAGVAGAMRNPSAEAMEPCIDSLEPMTLVPNL